MSLLVEEAKGQQLAYDLIPLLFCVRHTRYHLFFLWYKEKLPPKSPTQSMQKVSQDLLYK